MPKVQLPMELTIRNQTKGWITGYKLSETGDHEFCSENKVSSAECI